MESQNQSFHFSTKVLESEYIGIETWQIILVLGSDK